MSDEAPPVPMPSWGRSGETWRIEADRDWSTDGAGEWICSTRNCFGAAVAYRSRSGFAQCAEHLLSGQMWVRNGRVVAWTLRPRLAD